MTADLQDIEALLPYLTDEERAELDELLTGGPIWTPLPGPQTLAYESEADVIGYGGAAGGGKTDLACGLALTKHTKTAMFRREATQLVGIIDRFTELMHGRDGYNGADKIWRLPDRQIEFGSVPHAGDETRHQGRPKDLLVLDETANFLESQARFLMGWVRTTKKDQKCTVLMTFNPPTSSEGQWVIKFFAPWLEKNHPNPAAPGELRWFATIDSEDVEVDSHEPFEHDGETITPQSRTFIPSNVKDNPYLVGTGYMATLQALPEPLRSQMLFGDFQAGMEDDPWQVMPTAWVEAAMDRWEAKSPRGDMDSMGVDVARGGRDKTVIARRHVGMWFDEPLRYPGEQTPNGGTTAGLVVAARRDRAPVHIDLIGWGASAYDSLVDNEVQTVGINASHGSVGTTLDGGLQFANLRAEMVWRMREALDPKRDTGIALPKDNRLKADLCAYKWRLTGQGILIESKEDMIKRLGRSPDDGDAYCMANITTVKAQVMKDLLSKRDKTYDPHARLKRR